MDRWLTKRATTIRSGRRGNENGKDGRKRTSPSTKRRPLTPSSKVGNEKTTKKKEKTRKRVQQTMLDFIRGVETKRVEGTCAKEMSADVHTSRPPNAMRDTQVDDRSKDVATAEIADGAREANEATVALSAKNDEHDTTVSSFVDEKVDPKRAETVDVAKEAKEANEKRILLPFESGKQDVSESDEKSGENCAEKGEIAHENVESPTPSSKIADANAANGAGISEYEKRRLANMARNRMFLEKLGLEKPIMCRERDNRLAKKKKKRKRRGASNKKIVASETSRPRRRSSRLRKQPAIADPAEIEEVTHHEPLEDELPFDDSAVATYVAGKDHEKHTTDNTKIWLKTPDRANARQSVESGSHVARFREIVSRPLSNFALTKIYSLSFSADASLLAAAGHQGRAAIFSCTERGGSKDMTDTHVVVDDDDDDALMSFKAHSGWISSTLFLCGSPHVLLTAANDAVVTLWDVRKVLREHANARPKILHSANVHRTGIFCAHNVGDRLVTASKDKTVAYASVSCSDGVRVVRRFDDIHTKVVKSATLRDANVLASAGNDLSIVVADARQKAIVAEREDAHPYAINHVVWNPRDANELMTASFDNAIHLWDVRKFKTPKCSLRGHAMLHDGQRGRCITKPVYVAGGRCVATSGEKSNALSIFDVATGTLRSKGKISVGEVTSISPCDIWGSRIAASRGGNITLLDAVYEPPIGVK